MNIILRTAFKNINAGKQPTFSLITTVVSILKNNIALSSFLIFVFCCSVNIYSQEDSLKNKSYEYLLERISKFYNHDIEKTKLYTHTYLEKAKKDKDSLKITEAFYYLSQKSDYRKSLQYIDSASTYNQTVIKNKYHLFLHYQAGYLYYSKGKYKEALDSYLAAKKLIELSESKILHSGIEYNLGLVRLRIGEFNTAINIFKSSYNEIIKNNFQSKYSEIYLRNLAALTNSYWYLKQLDSAIYFNDLTIKSTIRYHNEKRYNESRVTQAIINYSKGYYRKGLDSIIKYAPLIEKDQDSFDLAITYLYKGKFYQKLNDWENALKQFKKVDTIIQNNKRYTAQIVENYKILYEYYKKKGDTKNHILYLERLLDFDSIMYNNNIYIKTTFLNKYDAPKLIEEKETLIKQLENKGSNRLKTLYVLSGFIIILSSLLYYNHKKKQVYKKRFEELISDKTSHLSNLKNVSLPIKKELKIPEAIIQNILKNLQTFEQKQQFLENDVSLHSLAKKIGTNSAYLSKVVNHYKNKNFNSYVSDLRIDYVINTLKSQPKLRKYTIRAIAFEIGFKNTESFNASFYKKTKLYPSYFIKELQKREKKV